MTHYRKELEKQSQQFHDYMVRDLFTPQVNNPDKGFQFTEWIYAFVVVGWILLFANIFFQE